MKFDNIIIGGGLSGLTCGISLAEQGRRCAIVSSGQSAIHFFSGSFDLLSHVGEQDVENPLEAMALLPGTHPYQRLGLENVEHLAVEAQQLLERAGLSFMGSAERNHFALTPMGTMKPTWLTLDDFSRFEQKVFPYRRGVVFNFTGFVDFHTLFVKDGLSKLGVDVKIRNIGMGIFEAIRRNPSEMRSTNIAKKFDKGAALTEFSQMVNEAAGDADVVILPSVFGLFKGSVATELKQKVEKPLVLIPVVPPSVSGIRSQIMLKKRFQELGGTYLLGDNVELGEFDNNRLLAIQTSNHGDIRFEADQFILATGSFYSKGIVAAPDKVYEPIFGLDVDGHDDRSAWFDEEIFNPQPYMHFGVKTDTDFRALMDDESVDNLYVAGSVLGGANSLKEGSGAGVSMLTSLYVAEQLMATRS